MVSASSSASTLGWSNLKPDAFLAVFGDGRLHHPLDTVSAQAPCIRQPRPSLKLLLQIEILQCAGCIERLLGPPRAEVPSRFLGDSATEDQLHTVGIPGSRLSAIITSNNSAPRRGRSKICVRLTSICQTDESSRSRSPVARPVWRITGIRCPRPRRQSRASPVAARPTHVRSGTASGFTEPSREVQ